jgi:hypothetical protein
LVFWSGSSWTLVIAARVLASKWPAITSPSSSITSRQKRAISRCLERTREEPQVVFLLVAVAVSLGSTSPRMMSEMPVIW